MAKPPPGAPWVPPEYTPDIVTAIQALNSGKDVPGYLAKKALDWIIDVCAGTYDLSYRPNSDRDTAFAEGKRFVGSQIVKLTKINPQQLAAKRPTGKDPTR